MLSPSSAAECFIATAAFPAGRCNTSGKTPTLRSASLPSIARKPFRVPQRERRLRSSRPPVRAGGVLDASSPIEQVPSPAPEAILPVHGVTDMVVGVLGGGQLGRMLCQAASSMAIKVMTLDPAPDCPAAALSYNHVRGRFDDGFAVQEFAKRCGVLTVEIEHVDADTLEKLEQHGIDCQPRASTIKIIQDKYLQKVHFSGHGIPLPDFMQIESIEDAERVAESFGYPLMIKSRRLAYDGRGNAVAYSKEGLSPAISALGGCERGLYIERWTPFAKELAVIVARGRNGSVSCYPVVETIHKDNICHIVEAPANVPEKIKVLACDVARKAVGSLQGAGVFAVELFLTMDDKVLLNEVAPRPHNSGHYTIESCYTSQYEQHLRAVLGLPLGVPSMKIPAAVMYNVLGEDEGEAGFALAHRLARMALEVPGAAVHWYDKKEMKKSRKMGHITIIGPSMRIVKARLSSLLGSKSTGDPSRAAPCVSIIMGSDSDFPTMKKAAEVLKNFDVPFEVKIISAHRTAEEMHSFAACAKQRGIQVIIAGAGGAAHLPGMTASSTPLPVIGVPIKTSFLDGMDSLLSIVQMPRGVPVATVGVGNADNAALLAVRILATRDERLSNRLNKFQEEMKESVLRKTQRMEEVGWSEYPDA